MLVELLEGLSMYSGVTMSVGSSSVTAYYLNNFVNNDIDVTRGTLSGTSGSTLLATSSAALAFQTLFMVNYFKYMVKSRKNMIRVNHPSETFHKFMNAFWSLMFLFSLLSIIVSALTIHMVENFSDLGITIDSDNKVNGTYGNAVEGLTYTVLAIGGLSLMVYLYTMIFVKKGLKFSMQETSES